MASGLYDDLGPAWKKHLFAQFHDVLAGTSVAQVYADLYDDYTYAFDRIDRSVSACSEKLLGKGENSYVFNPLCRTVCAPVILNEAPCKESGYLTDSKKRLIPFQKTYDGNTVFVAEDLPALAVEKYTCAEGTRRRSRLRSRRILSITA